MSTNLKKVPDYVNKLVSDYALYLPSEEPSKESVLVFDSLPEFGGFDARPKAWITGSYYVRLFFSAGYEQTGVVALRPLYFDKLSVKENNQRQEKLAEMILISIDAFRGGEELKDLYGSKKNRETWNALLQPYYLVQGYAQLR